MGKSFEKQIRKSLENYREQPSEGCWESLSRQLDALHQVPASSQTPLVETARTTAAKTVLGSTAAKIGMAAAAAAGLIAGGLLLFSPGTETAMTPPAGQLSAVLTDSLSAGTLPADTPSAVTVVKSRAAEETPSNTTFSEGIPAYLLLESEDAKPAREKAHTAADSTRGYAPRPAATVAGRTDATATAERTETGRCRPAGKADTVNRSAQSVQPELRIPNVITPNGDNINDYFVIENLEQTEHNRLVIFNRYNKVVYERKNYDNGWNADDLPEGIYRYWLSFEYGGHEFMRQGSIKVVR